LADKPYGFVRRPRRFSKRLMAKSNSEDVVDSSVAASVSTEVGQAQPAEVGVERAAGRPAAYSRSVLRIQVPVHVILASQRISIQEILELGPGSIVKFGKTCGEPLDVSAGGRTIAQGEVIKVGDKFGVRISGLVK
jgi:flagellar motor switch protein FliN